ncbi:MAG: DUF433 domain-containing protein [Planctomycetes bacterium]|nr:DUF433 domain-containing protein [Planctomycetota bacterium]
MMMLQKRSKSDHAYEPDRPVAGPHFVDDPEEATPPEIRPKTILPHSPVDLLNELSPEDVRIVGTRVPLECVVEAHRQGAFAEQIVEQYPTLSLLLVQQVVAYDRQHPEEVGLYLDRARTCRAREREKRAATPSALRAKLKPRPSSSPSDEPGTAP